MYANNSVRIGKLNIHSETKYFHFTFGRFRFGRFGVWPFWCVAILDFHCGRFGLVYMAVSVTAVLLVAVLVCGRFGCNSYG